MHEVGSCSLSNPILFVAFSPGVPGDVLPCGRNWPSLPGGWLKLSALALWVVGRRGVVAGLKPAGRWFNVGAPPRGGGEFKVSEKVGSTVVNGEARFDRVLAPAKINLWLHVLCRRDDGYHELDMLMQCIDLCDELEIRLDDSGEVRVDCPGLVLPPGGENLAARAARLMLRLAEAGRTGCRVTIRKRIPAGGGLGGGSSDAAAVMLVLNERLGLRLTKQELIRHGVRLGADIPFFLFEVPAARAGGIGEVLEPVGDLPDVWYLLVNPKVAVSTAWAFGNLGLTVPRQAAKLREFPRTTEALLCLLHNDLEAVTCSRYHQVAEAKRALLELGAEGALMSGSGATVFGVFSDEGRARQAGERLAEERNWQVFVARPYRHSTCDGRL